VAESFGANSAEPLDDDVLIIVDGSSGNLLVFGSSEPGSPRFRRRLRRDRSVLADDADAVVDDDRAMK